MTDLQTISKLKIKMRKKKKFKINVSEPEIPKNVKRNNYINDIFGYYVIFFDFIQCIVFVFTYNSEEHKLVVS